MLPITYISTPSSLFIPQCIRDSKKISKNITLKKE